MDFRKKHKLDPSKKSGDEEGDDPQVGQDSFKKEYKSTRDALGEFSPFRWRHQLLQIRNFTPEEYETLEDCIFELKTNIKCYSFFSLLGFLSFNYWQRQYVPRRFYLLSIGISMAAGTFAGCLKTSWYYVEQMDKLGEEYELSRSIKQDIFDTRPDMNTAMRA